MQPVVNVHYFHEIALKGLNRHVFLHQAARNLKRALAGTRVRLQRPHQMSATLTSPGDEAWPQLKDCLEKLIGVERFERAYPVAPAMDAIQEVVQALLERERPPTPPDAAPNSFRISASRGDKAFKLTSPEINAQLGTFVKERTGMRVDLKHPALDIRVHVQPGAAYLSVEEYRGLGGMPVGVSGKVVAMLSGGIDSPVAAYQMMTRGCECIFVHFHSFPLVEGTSRDKARDLAEVLARYQFRSPLYLVSLADTQKRILMECDPEYRVVLYRRFMVRIAERIALKEGALALVTGESVGQVSSQTLENMLTINSAMTRLPILRPLVTYDKEAIMKQARWLGTYDISIQPDEDCCSLFVPPHPATRATPELAAQEEASLDVPALVQAAVDQAELWRATWPESRR
jgi:thiamine biosynthesis protein ThiI